MNRFEEREMVEEPRLNRFMDFLDHYPPPIDKCERDLSSPGLQKPPNCAPACTHPLSCLVLIQVFKVYQPYCLQLGCVQVNWFQVVRRVRQERLDFRDMTDSHWLGRSAETASPASSTHHTKLCAMPQYLNNYVLYHKIDNVHMHTMEK